MERSEEKNDKYNKVQKLDLKVWNDVEAAEVFSVIVLGLWGFSFSIKKISLVYYKGCAPRKSQVN